MAKEFLWSHIAKRREFRFNSNNPARKGLVEDYNDYPFLGPKD